MNRQVHKLLYGLLHYYL